MSDGQLEQHADTNEWQVVALRLTAFPVAPVVAVGKNLWKDLVGEEPHEQRIQPKAGVIQELGLVDSMQLTVSANPAIIDWRLTPPNPQELSFEGIVSIGLFTRGLEIFLPLMLRWLDGQSPELQRLAFGAELVLPMESHVAAYQRLASYLPIKIDPEGSTDFFYQINRPRTSRANSEALRLNRFTKWSALKSAYGVQVGGQSFELPGLEYFACRLELDINTAADFPGTLQGEQLSAVFMELVELGREISIAGDKP